MKTRYVGAVCAALFIIGISAPARSAVIDAYFGMNFTGVGDASGYLAANMEVDLTSITYIGGGGLTYTTSMPVFPGEMAPDINRTGLPDGIYATFNSSTGQWEFVAPTFSPTYTTTTSGDGETTRTIGATVPINWGTSGAFPTIQIQSITAEVSFTAGAGNWTGAFATPYTVGLIPAGPNTELTSALSGPQGDIYGSLAGAVGNPTRTAIVTSVPSGSGLEPLIGAGFGDFIFAAATPTPVPMPAAVWLFGSGLLGLIGFARRKARST